MGIWTRIKDLFQNEPSGRVSVTPVFQQGRELPSPRDFRKLTDEGYRKSSIIHACINEIASSIAEPDLLVVRPNAEGELDPVSDTHPLQRILDRPNPLQSQYELLELLLIHYFATGNSYIHKVRSQRDLVRELYIRRPDRMFVVPGNFGPEEWIFKVEGRERARFAARDIIHFKKSDPLDDFYGLSPIIALARHGDLDIAASDYLRTFFTTAGIPPLVIKTKGATTPQQRQQIKSRWIDEHNTEHGWHVPTVIDEDVEIDKVGADFDKLNMEKIFDVSESRICATFGVPPIIVGMRLGIMRATYANYQEARKSFWQETLIPLFSRLGDALSILGRDFGDPRIRVVFDLTKVEALQENKEDLRKHARGIWNDGLATRNEARQLIDLPPLDGTEGDIFKPSTTDRAIEETQSLERFARFTDDDPDSPQWQQIHNTADKHTPQIVRIVSGLAGELRSRLILSRLSDRYRARDLPGIEALIPFDAAVEAANTQEVFEDTFRSIVSESAKKSRRFFPEDTKIDFQRTSTPAFGTLFNTKAEEFASEHAAELVAGVSEQQRRAVRRTVEKMFAEDIPAREAAEMIADIVGLSERDAVAVANFRLGLVKAGVDKEKIASRVARFSKRKLKERAIRIARTEAINAASEGQQLLWQTAVDDGVIEPDKAKKEWIVTPDDRLDLKICLPMDKQRVGLNEFFTTGLGDRVRRPTAHVGCRCSMALVVE